MIAILREKLKSAYTPFRPIYKPLIESFNKVKQLKNTFYVPIDKLLLGGNNGIRAAKYAEITDNFLLPSTLVSKSPHVEFLNEFDRIKNPIFEDQNFHKTAYYERAFKCMKLTGYDFYDDPRKIVDLAKSFIKQYTGEDSKNVLLHPGQSEIGAPIWIRPIKYSSYYEIIDGHHRAALAFKNGVKLIKALVYYKDAVFTPLQQLLLDVMWINKQKWLYQPVYSPEINEQWTLVRNCEDRLHYITQFLEGIKFKKNKEVTFLDVGSSYGWFVSKMLEKGYNAYGVERDIISIEVGKRFYGLDNNRVFNDEIGRFLKNTDQRFDVISCMSVLHHFVLNKNSTSAVEFIQLLDKITGKVLFIDTAQSHEKAFVPLLSKWDDEYIQEWVKNNTSFSKVIPLGRDNDSKGVFSNYYNRTLFACIRE